MAAVPPPGKSNPAALDNARRERSGPSELPTTAGTAGKPPDSRHATTAEQLRAWSPEPGQHPPVVLAPSPLTCDRSWDENEARVKALRALLPLRLLSESASLSELGAHLARRIGQGQAFVDPELPVLLVELAQREGGADRFQAAFSQTLKAEYPALTKPQVPRSAEEIYRLRTQLAERGFSFQGGTDALARFLVDRTLGLRFSTDEKVLSWALELAHWERDLPRLEAEVQQQLVERYPELSAKATEAPDEPYPNLARLIQEEQELEADRKQAMDLLHHGRDLRRATAGEQAVASAARWADETGEAVVDFGSAFARWYGEQLQEHPVATALGTAAALACPYLLYGLIVSSPAIALPAAVVLPAAGKTALVGGGLAFSAYAGGQLAGAAYDRLALERDTAQRLLELDARISEAKPGPERQALLKQRRALVQSAAEKGYALNDTLAEKATGVVAGGIPRGALGATHLRHAFKTSADIAQEHARVPQQLAEQLDWHRALDPEVRHGLPKAEKAPGSSDAPGQATDALPRRGLEQP